MTGSSNTDILDILDRREPDPLTAARDRVMEAELALEAAQTAYLIGDGSEQQMNAALRDLWDAQADLRVLVTQQADDELPF